MTNGNNINFNFKLLRRSCVIAEQRISIPAERITEAIGETDQQAIESIACEIMYDVEKAINADYTSTHGLRCHIEQLPSDVPADMKLEEENVE